MAIISKDKLVYENKSPYFDILAESRQWILAWGKKIERPSPPQPRGEPIIRLVDREYHPHLIGVLESLYERLPRKYVKANSGLEGIAEALEKTESKLIEIEKLLIRRRPNGDDN